MSGLRYIFPLAQRAPWLLPAWTWLLWGRAGKDQAQMEAALGQIQDKIAERDRELYAQVEPRRRVAASMVEGFRQGTRGMAHDAMLFGRPWGFRLEHILHPRVFVWHGEQDTNVPPSFGRVFANKIPNCTATFFPEDGHLSIIVDHGLKIFATLAGEVMADQPQKRET
jgi:pimeloyl-ACP methyl ester carboxylesterase